MKSTTRWISKVKGHVRVLVGLCEANVDMWTKHESSKANRLLTGE